MAQVAKIIPNSIKIDNKVIIYDIFYSNIKNCIAIIFNPGHLCEEEVEKIKVFCNENGNVYQTELIGSDIHHSRSCKSNNRNSRMETEASGILYFKYKTDNIIVKYENISKEINLKNKILGEESNDVLLSTLIHYPTYHGITNWINYHNKKYGIKNFSLYLNDYSETNYDYVLNAVTHIDDINVNIIEWNFQWWCKIENRAFHGAQMQSLNHAMHYFNHKSILFTDLDEYLVTSDLTTILQQNKNYAYVVIQNKWGKRLNINNKFGDSQAIIYNSDRDNSIVKNLIIDRKKIKVVLVHGSFAYEGYSSRMLDIGECFFIHYMDHGRHADRINNMRVRDERIIKL
jgi:hypothetical protein